MNARPCATCPAANGPHPCLGLQDGYDTFCERALQGDNWVEHIRWRSAVAAGAIVLPEPDEPIPQASPVVEEGPGLPVAGLGEESSASGGCGCQKPLEMPSYAQQLVNVGTALAAHAANGFKKLGEEETAARLAVCGGCPFLSRDRRCFACGCPVDRKAAWESAHCDRGYWPTVKHSPALAGPS